MVKELENNILYAKERQDKILNLLDQNGRVKVSELVSKFSVSGSTIRTDLRQMEKERLLTRTHGGAIKILQRNFEDIPITRDITPAKRAIADQAVALITDGDSLMIDTGTSCLAFTEALINSKKKNLRILTYDLQEALLLSDSTNYQIQLLGGGVRNGFHYAYGEEVVQQIKQYLVDKAILATTSMTVVKGFSTPNVSTATLKQAVLEIARTKIMLCDSEKIGQDSFRIFAKVNEIDTLITDDQITDSTLKAIKKQKVKVNVAPVPR